MLQEFLAPAKQNQAEFSIRFHTMLKLLLLCCRTESTLTSNANFATWGFVLDISFLCSNSQPIPKVIICTSFSCLSALDVLPSRPVCNNFPSPKIFPLRFSSPLKKIPLFRVFLLLCKKYVFLLQIFSSFSFSSLLVSPCITYKCSFFHIFPSFHRNLDRIRPPHIPCFSVPYK